MAQYSDHEQEGNEEMGEYEIDIEHCIWKDCKGDLVQLEAFARFNWVTVSYHCTRCHRDFTIKIET